MSDAPTKETIRQVIASGPFGPTGNRSRRIAFRHGMRMGSLVFLSIGASIQYLLLEMSGIRATCISRVLQNISIISRPMGHKQSLAIRTLFRSSRLKNLMPITGPIFSAGQALSLLSLLLNIMMVFPSMIPLCQNGIRPRWGRNAISSANWRRLYASSG